MCAYDNITDSTLGKVMEKAGNVMHNEGLVSKGTAKREDAMVNAARREEPPFAN
jgi:uncharacterized protein YjbJ (UPF0337 family)